MADRSNCRRQWTSKTKVLTIGSRSRRKANSSEVPTGIGINNTKQDIILGFLSQGDGAIIQDIMDQTGWQQHSVRGFPADTIKRKLGLEQTSFKKKGKLRRYRLVGVQAASG